MAGDVSDEEAAWRDLVARLAAPAVTDSAAPWPSREELPTPRQAATADADYPGPADTGPAHAGPEPADTGPADTGPGPAEPEPEPEPAEPDTTDQVSAFVFDPVPGVIPAPPQARIIRPAAAAPLPGDDEGHYLPPPPPPLPRLDPVSKAAWAALFGGPGYLLLAVMLSWDIPGWAAFSAVAAFIGGFATLVVRMGDGPPRDSGPDNGAVL